MTRRRLTKKQIADWFLEHGGICHICETKIHVGEAWEREHVIPLAAGGSDDLENQRPAHVKCHKVKTAEDRGVIAKVERQRQKHLGIKKPRAAGRYRQRMNGEIIDRETGAVVRPART